MTVIVAYKQSKDHIARKNKVLHLVLNYNKHMGSIISFKVWQNSGTFMKSFLKSKMPCQQS